MFFSFAVVKAQGSIELMLCIGLHKSFWDFFDYLDLYNLLWKSCLLKNRSVDRETWYLQNEHSTWKPKILKPCNPFARFGDQPALLVTSEYAKLQKLIHIFLSEGRNFCWKEKFGALKKLECVSFWIQRVRALRK